MKISIIIPAYNSAATIERCIDSILSQDGAKLEIIVVNDGSADNTDDVLSRYAGRIRLINRENGGAAHARNTGLREATGDFVMFVDSDDFIKEGCIAALVKKQQETHADIIRFQYVISGKSGALSKPLHCFDSEQLVVKDEFKEKLYPLYITSIMLNSICMTLFKREIIEGLSFRTDMKTAEDAVFSLQAYTRAESVLILPDEYYVYNMTAGSLTGSGSSLAVKYRCNFELSFEIIRHLPEWGMNNPYWFFLALFRPVMLTFDKMRRMQLSRRKQSQMEEE